MQRNALRKRPRGGRVSSVAHSSLQVPHSVLSAEVAGAREPGKRPKPTVVCVTAELLDGAQCAGGAFRARPPSSLAPAQVSGTVRVFGFGAHSVLDNVASKLAGVHISRRQCEHAAFVGTMPHFGAALNDARVACLDNEAGLQAGCTSFFTALRRCVACVNLS